MTKNEVLNILLETNKPNYNILKAIEELTELSEVLIKRVLKEKAEKNPSDQSIIEEIGDVEIRLQILKKMFGEDKVDERVNIKIKKYETYINNKQYIGSI